MSTSPVILILGAGANVGAALARKFSAEGFKVASAARNAHKDVVAASDLTLKADFTDPSSIGPVFDEVHAKLGIPSVVVYNAATAKATKADDTLSVPLEDLTTALTVGVTSAFVAAQQAVLGFQRLGPELRKTFIFTGNICNVSPIPSMLSLGVPKAATANLIWTASLSYKEAGYRFYYGDERTAEGKPMYNALSGTGHADFYYALSQQKEQGPWLATFVTGKGYTDFGGK